MNIFLKTSKTKDESFFSKQFESEVKAFLDQYDNGEVGSQNQTPLEMDILNSNFTVQEVEAAIDYLKNNKSPGCDNIPAEFIKYCKEILLEDLTTIYNYIIESRDFPDIWAEGLRSVIFKAGQRNLVKNYRGITVLSIFAKLFEILVHSRMTFVNEAFCKIDEFNGGFLRGCRTTDNMFVLNGLVQRQIAIGKPLYICYVDFSMAFDLVNRHILFYKLITQGWSGRVIDTMRNFYSKTYFRIKLNGRISPPIANHVGVNQGGNVSGLLFRKYMADLSKYLHTEVGICLGDSIVAHLLWADDLILLSDSVSGLQKQLNGLFRFCSDNMMIVNEMKTKVMVYGPANRNVVFKFNGKTLDIVDQYKYLGNITKSIKTWNGDMFGANYQYLCNKARQAIFALFKRVKTLGILPVKVMLYLFRSLIRPILTYGSDVWGVNFNATKSMDKIFLWYARTILEVKPNTCNLITMGECGEVPPSVICHKNVMCYYKRLQGIPENSLAIRVFYELKKLNDMGFKTWVTSVRELASRYNVSIDSELDVNVFKQKCQETLERKFILDWQNEIVDDSKHPILKTYKMFKSEFKFEPYLELLKDPKYRIAVSKLRASSHMLEIERGRHTRPITPVENRRCPKCNVIENEIHFVLECTINQNERLELFDKIRSIDSCYIDLPPENKFVYLMNSENVRIMKWFAKFVYSSFDKRSKFHNSPN